MMQASYCSQSLWPTVGLTRNIFGNVQEEPCSSSNMRISTIQDAYSPPCRYYSEPVLYNPYMDHIAIDHRTHTFNSSALVPIHYQRPQEVCTADKSTTWTDKLSKLFNIKRQSNESGSAAERQVFSRQSSMPTAETQQSNNEKFRNFTTGGWLREVENIEPATEPVESRMKSAFGASSRTCDWRRVFRCRPMKLGILDISIPLKKLTCPELPSIRSAAPADEDQYGRPRTRFRWWRSLDYDNINEVIALICGVLVIVLMALGLASADWLMAAGWRQGLFAHCIEPDAPTPLPFNVHSPPGCYSARDVPYIRAAAGLCIVTLATDVCGAVLTGMGLRASDHRAKFRYYRLAVLAMALALISILIALVIYPVCFAAELNLGNRTLWEFGWAYGVGWGAAIFLFGAVVLLLCDKESEEIYYKERKVVADERERDRERGNPRRA